MQTWTNEATEYANRALMAAAYIAPSYLAGRGTVESVLADIQRDFPLLWADQAVDWVQIAIAHWVEPEAA